MKLLKIIKEISKCSECVYCDESEMNPSGYYCSHPEGIAAPILDLDKIPNTCPLPSID